MPLVMKEIFDWKFFLLNKFFFKTKKTKNIIRESHYLTQSISVFVGIFTFGFIMNCNIW